MALLSFLRILGGSAFFFWFCSWCLSSAMTDPGHTLEWSRREALQTMGRNNDGTELFHDKNTPPGLVPQ